MSEPPKTISLATLADLGIPTELAERLEGQLAELGTRIERLADEGTALRIAAEEADALAPTDKLQRLRRLADLERRVREADQATWALLDEVFALRQNLLSHETGDGERAHEN